MEPAIGRNGYVLFANITSDLFAFRPGASQQPDWSRSTFRGGLVSETAYLPGEALVNGPQSRNSPAIWCPMVPQLFVSIKKNSMHYRASMRKCLLGGTGRSWRLRAKTIS